MAPTTEKPKVFTDEERAEIKEIFQETLREFFFDAGSFTKKIIYGTASILAALAIIFGSVKAIAALVGIGFVSGGPK